jgi:hypothetical protein
MVFFCNGIISKLSFINSVLFLQTNTAWDHVIRYSRNSAPFVICGFVISTQERMACGLPYAVVAQIVLEIDQQSTVVTIV